MGDEEYVNMPVPRSRIQEVYELLGTPGRDAAPNRTYDEKAMHGLWQEASPEMRRVLQHLALHPEERVPAAHLVEVADIGTGRALGGMFARFRQRCLQKYHRDVPWETITIGDVNYYVMSRANSQLIEPLW